MATLEHDVLLLAAGGSRRMGLDKARLQRDGEALLTRSARILASQSPQHCLAVLGAWADERCALLPEGWEVVIYPDWPQGMAGSLQCGLRRLQSTRHVLVGGIDQPGLAPLHPHALLSAAAEAPHAVVVSDYGGAFGLPTLLPANVHVRHAELHGDQGFKQLLRDPDIACVHVAAPELALDVDTPDDLERARQRGWIDSEA